MRFVREYEWYVGSDKFVGRVFGIFVDLEVMRKDGIVLREEFISVFVEYGIVKGKVEEIVDNFFCEGYFYEFF